MRTASILHTGLVTGLVVTSMAPLAGCGDTKSDDPTMADPTASATDDEGSESPTDPTEDPTGDSTESPDPTGADGSSDDGSQASDTAAFILDPDGGGITNECDIWAQDCATGEKCMPWANDGGGSWNATRCSPLDDNPAQPGDSCTVDGSGVSGIDNCDLSSMCWNVDGDTNLGVCVGFCEGGEASPVCPDPSTGCSVTNSGVLILCLPFCDPLLQDCSDTEACYPEPNGFFCSPNASGKAGAYGDECEFLNACDQGLYCADAAAVPGCAGAAGCCSEFCDTTEPVACMGAGQECTAYYEVGQAPPGYEDTGVCQIPQ